VGGTTDAGLPTASSVAAGTDNDARTLAGRAVAPVFAEEAGCDAVGDDPPVALSSTIVAMTATTSPTGTSAVSTGCRERNEARAGALRPEAVPDPCACRPPRLLAGGRFVAAVAVAWPPAARFLAAAPGGLPPGGRLVADLVDWFFVVGRTCRDDPVVAFDMSFS